MDTPTDLLNDLRDQSLGISEQGFKEYLRQEHKKPECALNNPQELDLAKQLHYSDYIETLEFAAQTRKETILWN